MVSTEVIAWHDTSHSLPADNESVLIQSGNTVFDGYRSNGTWRIYGVHGPMQLKRKVDYWAKLPKGPPKKKAAA